ncbi:uncharacterized protein LOC115579887 [Sparus aurata]|uniref:uncharacterized protein LOC115579887 n=1 Tax=Sparus aurata TaxID=8175 RepID=UPI0011C1C109|nr:uncharacterized protein LOC115579887 [Sparus aurata]
MLQRPADPLSAGGACSINQIGGGGGDREAEQDAVVERESGSVSFSDDDDDDDNEVRPPIQVRDIPNFNAMELRQRLDFRDISLDNPKLVPRRIRERLSGVIDRALDGTHPGSILNAVLRGPSLANDVQAILNSDNQYNTDLFLEEISRVLQSNDTSMSDDELEFIVTVVQNRSGGKRKNINKIPYNKILSEKTRFLFNPDNRGGNNLCFSLCLARFEKKRQEEEKQKLLAQTVDVETLDEQTYAENTHLKILGDLTSCASFDKVTAFEREINAKIIIFHNTAGRKRLACYKTHDKINKHTVWLYLRDNHYYLIENPAGFFGSAYVCNYCYETYEAVLRHSCKLRCNVCFTNACHRHPTKTVKCGDCKRICKSNFCHKQHKMVELTHKTIPCDRLRYCETCGSVYTVGKGGKTHKCRPLKCRHCNEEIMDVKAPHQCYIQPLKKKKPTDKYLVYDFESRHHNGRHEANFCCVKDLDGKNMFCFPGLNCVEIIVERYRKPEYDGYTFIAHNASGFDNYILLEYMVKNKIAPELTMRGSRVNLMYDRAYKQRWIDSFSFLPMRLSKIPAALGFEDMMKGYFPHKFNTVGNEKYVGDDSEPYYYGYDNMSGSEKITFMAWYNTSAEKLSTLRKRFSSIVSMMWMCCSEDVVSIRILFGNAQNLTPLSLPHWHPVVWVCLKHCF